MGVKKKHCQKQNLCLLHLLSFLFHLPLFSSGFPASSAGKESTCNAGDPGSIPGSERSRGEGIGYRLQYPWASLVAQLAKNLRAMWETRLGRPPGEGKGYPPQCSGLEHSMDCIVHGVAKSRTRLNDFHLTSLFSLSLFFSSLFIPLFLSPPCLTCPALLSLYLFLSSRGLHERMYNTWLPTVFNQMCVMFVTMIGNFYTHDWIQQPCF